MATSIPAVDEMVCDAGRPPHPAIRSVNSYCATIPHPTATFNVEPILADGLGQGVANAEGVFEDVRPELINLREDINTLDCDLDDRLRDIVEDMVEEKILKYVA